MKKYILMLFGFIVIACAQPAMAKEEMLNRIVVVVDKGIITESQLNERVSLVKHNLERSNTPLPNMDILREQVLQQMINQQIQLNLATQTSVRVTDDEVNSMIQALAKQNNKTVDELYNDITSKGDSYNSFRQEMRDELIIHKLQQRDVASKVIVTDQEVTDYLRRANALQENQVEYNIDDILIALPESPTPEQITQARDTAEKLVKKANTGTNFKTLAVEHSSGEQALKGGELGWRKLAELPDVFAEKIINMKKGGIAGPIKTSNGFHVIRLTDTRKANIDKNANEDMQRMQIRQLLFQRKLNERLMNWLIQLRANAYINIIDDNNA